MKKIEPEVIRIVLKQNVLDEFEPEDEHVLNPDIVDHLTTKINNTNRRSPFILDITATPRDKELFLIALKH